MQAMNTVQPTIAIIKNLTFSSFVASVTGKTGSTVEDVADWTSRNCVALSSTFVVILGRIVMDVLGTTLTLGFVV